MSIPQVFIFLNDPPLTAFISFLTNLNTHFVLSRELFPSLVFHTMFSPATKTLRDTGLLLRLL